MAWKKIQNGDGVMSTPWKFEEMGELEGIFVVSKKAKSKKGKPITFHEFESMDGRRVSVLGGAVLDRTFGEIEKGTRVKIEFLGEVEGKDGTYKNYDVSIWEDE